MVFKQIINYIKQNTYDIIFDIRYGLDTVSRVNLEDTSVGLDGKKRGNKYQPTGFSRSIAILKRIKKYGSKGLVDFGSGKGQVLLAASELGYSQIKGVEFVKEFHDIAVKNIAQWSNKQINLYPSLFALMQQNIKLKSWINSFISFILLSQN